MTRSARAPALLIVVAGLLAPATAGAQPDPVQAQAQRVSAEGDKHYALTEYEPAIASYKEAYRLVPAPLLLFNIARSYRMLGACQQARTFFNNYLSTGDAEYRERAEQRIAAIDAGADDRCIPGKVIEAPAAPPAPVDPVGPGPAVGDPVAEPDPAGAITAAPEVGVAAAHDRGPSATPAPDRGRRKRIAGLVTIGAGVVLAGTGGYFSTRAAQAARDVEDACADGCVADDVAGRDAEGKAAQRNATIFYGVAGVAVAAGAAVVVWGWQGGRRPDRRVVVAPSRSGAVAVAAWSF